MPNSLVDILGDAKGSGRVTGILNGINTGLMNGRKIELRILIAEPLTPWLHFAAKNLFV